MEGFGDGDDPAIWRAVNDVAAMIKALDPNHPTMSVTAFVHGGRIEHLHRRSPAIDVHGVNAYGGAQSVPQWLREGGATKPFVMTEFGPLGPWEMPTTDWGAPYEQTSTDKARVLSRELREGRTRAGRAVAGFLRVSVGPQDGGDATWFGMFLDDGTKPAWWTP